MNRLRMTGGAGRLSRSGRIIIFSFEPDDELHQLRPKPGGEIFKALATLIVAREFAVPSFAAIDLESSGLFVFGEIEIEVDGARVSGADSATWTEVRFTPGAQVVSVGMSNSTGDTDLVEGCVPAAAFSLNQVPATLDVPHAIEAPEAAVVQPETPPAVEAELFDADETEDPSEEIVVTETAVSPAPPAPVEPDPAGSDSGPATSPFRAPPLVNPLRSHGTPDADASVPTSARRARLQCGNGQTVVFGQGLLVGRFPSKHGVPDGYEIFKVNGGEVSRVHLVFVVEGDKLHVQDQNTPNGSTLVSAQREIRPVPSGSEHAALEPGDSVEFGDQTMTFLGWDQPEESASF